MVCTSRFAHVTLALLHGAGPIYGWQDAELVPLGVATAKLPLKGTAVYVRAAIQFAKEFKIVSLTVPMSTPAKK